MTQPDDITLSRLTRLHPIEEIGAEIGLKPEDLYRYGSHKAKVDPSALQAINNRAAKAKMILVTAISPTPAGEGKTTTTIGLGDALRQAGHKTIICLREPSLGPCFGLKGGATGGGHAQVAPMDEINLHFTGDFHAITSANNLLAALIDNHIYWGNAQGIDPSKVTWRRVMDMNDRALRHMVVGMGNNGQVREDGMDITVASEVMAIFCLATSLKDLEERLSRIVVATRFDKMPVTAGDLNAAKPMTALLRDAFYPNLVQTLEHTPAFVHGGPFANIAHGCNSVVATKAALRMADYVVTEAGFGADLGAEKFLNIKCRQAEIKPDAVVIVATVRALKMHAGIGKDDLSRENVQAVEEGFSNLAQHIENIQKFGLPAIVAINHFTSDTSAEMEAIKKACQAMGVKAHFCQHWAKGGAGASDLAADIIETVENSIGNFNFLYPDDMPLAQKIETVAKEIYRAKSVDFSPSALRKIKQFEESGYRKLPVCMAKTQYSFSADPSLRGAPKDHVVPVRDVRLSAGAGFIVALCGEIMTMPGLPRTPAANRIYVNDEGLIEGLF